MKKNPLLINDLIHNQLQDFLKLESGWLEGMGERFSPEKIAWAETFILEKICSVVTLPFLYPIEGENVSAEWDVGNVTIMLEIDLTLHQADFFSINAETTETETRIFDLNSENEVAALQTFLKERIL